MDRHADPVTAALKAAELANWRLMMAVMDRRAGLSSSIGNKRLREHREALQRLEEAIRKSDAGPLGRGVIHERS